MSQEVSVEGKEVKNPVRLKHTPLGILIRPQKIDINKANMKELVTVLGISKKLAKKIFEARNRKAFRSINEVKQKLGISPRILSRIEKKVVIGKINKPVITEINTIPDDLRAGKPFDLIIRFNNPLNANVTLMQLILEWKGSPYITQRAISDKERQNGIIEIKMDHIGKLLPVGPIDITVNLYDDAGGADYFAKNFYIMPNSVSLNVWPSGRTLPSGSWRGRADYDSSAKTFGCGINFDITNTESSTVTFRRWNFRVTDASLGELNNWNWDFPFNIVVGPGQVWSGWIYITFSSGNTYDLFKKGGDVTIRYRTTSTDGSWAITDNQIFGSMKGFGVNRIKVGTFTAAELNVVIEGLRNSASGIFEQRDLTIDDIWFGNVPSPGSYTVLNSKGEWEDLLDDWNGPSSRIDGFFVEDIAWGGYIGYSVIDGPCDRDPLTGSDGLAVEPMSSIDLMGVLWAHELGHYLGLDHSSDSSNFMYSSIATHRTNVTYGQYQKMRGHCYCRLLS